MRRDTSLLISEGYSDAASWPLWLVLSEAKIVLVRQEEALARQMTLTQSAIMSVMDKGANKAFQKQIKKLLRKD